MKYCPVCDGENEDNAQVCVLCDYRFTEMTGTKGFTEPEIKKPEINQYETSVTENKDAAGKTLKEEPPDYQQSKYEPYSEDYAVHTVQQDGSGVKKTAVMIVLAVLAAAAASTALFLGLNGKSDDSIAVSQPDEKIVTVAEMTAFSETAAETTIPETEAPVTTAVNIKRDTGYKVESINDIYSVYGTMLSEDKDFVTPSCCGMGDFLKMGYSQLIIPDLKKDKYRFYEYKDGNIYSTEFGKFLSASVIELYKVYNGSGSDNFIYYRTRYASRSYQGFYDPKTGNEIRVELAYSEKSEGQWKTDWVIYQIRNGEEKPAYEGSEIIDACYGATKDCHEALLKSHTEIGFGITDDFTFDEVKRMTPDETREQLKKNSEPTPTPPPPPPAAEPAYLTATKMWNGVYDYNYITVDLGSSYNYVLSVSADVSDFRIHHLLPDFQNPGSESELYLYGEREVSANCYVLLGFMEHEFGSIKVTYTDKTGIYREYEVYTSAKDGSVVCKPL